MLKIITDSTCDIGLEELKELNVIMAPLQVSFGTESFRDKIEISASEFYRKLEESKEMPITSLVSTGEFLEIFKRETEDGSELLVLTVSSVLSGTYQSAILAKDMIQDQKIEIIDTKLASMALGLIVRETVKLRDKGLSSEEIIEEINKLLPKVVCYAMISNLKYLHKGGRITSSSHLLGSILKIIPIIRLEDGALKIVGKASGFKKAAKKLMQLIAEQEIDKNYGIAIAQSEDMAKKDLVKSLLKENFDVNETNDYDIGPVIGTHAGPGAIGVAYITSKE